MAAGADLYVSPTGNDAAAGTIDAPLATLGAARTKADQLKAGNTPVTVYFRGGTYYLDTTVSFGPSNSGTAQAPITYMAYGSEKPVISGGIKLPDSLNWSVSSGQIQVCTIAKNLKVDQLFLNGKRQILARYPNFDSNTVILDGYAADCISHNRVALWSNPAEGPGYVRGLHQNCWGSNSFTITGKVGTDSVTLKWSGDNNNGSGLHPTYRMVENIFEELDAPGEWFYRKSTGQLYFYPPAGTNLKTALIELASQDQLISLVGTSTAKVSYLNFSGLTFTHTYRTLFSKPYESLLNGDWTIARAGAVYIDNCENIRVQNCFFDQIGGNGIFISGYNRNHVIYNNTFIDAGASCVAICGLMTAVRCARSNNCTDRTPGPQSTDYPEYITVDNNMMDHLGRFEKQTSGVTQSMCMFDTVRHNTVCRCPRAGINFTDGCWGGHEIEYNWVYKAVLETQDHGPFNAWGRDRNFKFSSDTSATQLDAMYTTNIHNNRLETAVPFFGVDLDDGSSNYNVYNNLTIGVGLKLWHTRHNRYVNNVIVSGGVTEFHDTWPFSNHYYAHNITFDTCVYSFCCFANMTPVAIPDSVKVRVKMVDSNCIWSLGKTPKMVQWTQRNTVVSTWADWLAAGLDAHSALSDPLFTDTAKVFRTDYQPRGDYSVRAGSPALALGFKNFPMDSFGVMPLPVSSVQSPYVFGTRGSENVSCAIRYNAGTLIVSQDGDYRLTVTTASGRTVKAINGKGISRFAFSNKTYGHGAYIASVRSVHGIVTRKFIVN
jgi:hypothetical protein